MNKREKEEKLENVEILILPVEFGDGGACG